MRFNKVKPGSLFACVLGARIVFYKVSQPETWEEGPCPACGDAAPWNARSVSSGRLAHVCKNEEVVLLESKQDRAIHETVYLQGDDARRFFKEGYCESCLRPAGEWARPDRFGGCEVHGDYDRGGNLCGFLCSQCAGAGS
ncbi:hypothetical membrane protein [Pelotomaculum thermopropionicum SI]|uniref:Hypothetical membrane protein n=1 Tax=Pelotomaculum thermopropionicum (strain DSM 13744 / JCM 10971 / SI) TaxID=370438 RepID=A5CZE6_PELTS|nr:hypothetical membrane protein [Pelotomaculum thermopropionicum SI]